jgi:branched-chain amino acid transport system substrate-binding protein
VSGRPLLAALTALAAVASACSVSVPRHETASYLRSGGRQVSASGDDAGVIGDGGGAASAADSGSAASGGGASSGAAAGPGAHGVAASAGARSSTAGGSSSPSGGGGFAPGVTKDSVTVSVIAGFSGPLAAMVTRAYDGLATWQDDVNAAGGINGRKVILKKVDHKETADGGVAACKEALSNGSYFAIVPEGVDATLTAVSCLDSAGMPTLYYSATTDPKWKVAFADVVTSQQGGNEMASYVADGLHAAGKKVGVIYVNQASYKAMNDGFLAQAGKYHLDVAPSESVEPNSASFTAPLLRLKNAGVQVLIVSATTDAIGILRDAKSLAWNPQFTGWGFQFDFITTGGRNLFDNVAALRAYAAVDSAAYTQYSARMQARGRGRGRTDDLEGFAAYGHALVLGEVIKRAGPNPTRASLIAGAESVRGYDNGILGPITWTSTDHVGIHSTFPVVCCNGDYTWKTTGPPGTSY